jgi:hypothetical protein
MRSAFYELTPPIRHFGFVFIDLKVRGCGFVQTLNPPIYAWLSTTIALQVTAAVTREFQEKRLLVTAVGDVPKLSGHKMAVAARHRSVP